jgi:hypothetical protein
VRRFLNAVATTAAAATGRTGFLPTNSHQAEGKSAAAFGEQACVIRPITARRGSLFAVYGLSAVLSPNPKDSRFYAIYAGGLVLRALPGLRARGSRPPARTRGAPGVAGINNIWALAVCESCLNSASGWSPVTRGPAAVCCCCLLPVWQRPFAVVDGICRFANL